MNVDSFTFNTDPWLQKRLKEIVPEHGWSYLQKKYDFGFKNPIL